MTAAEHASQIESLVQGILQQAERVAMVRTFGFVGSAGEASSPAANFNSPLPWLPNMPGAMLRDTDGDGIPDALDYYFGPGAFPPGYAPGAHH